MIPSIQSVPDRSTRAAEGSPHLITSPKEGHITKSLFTATEVVEFKNELARLFFEQLILPFQDTASNRMLETAKVKIRTAVYLALNGHMYHGVRDIYLLLHLLHSRTTLFNTLQLIQLEVADENPVDPHQLRELIEQVFTATTAEFERHHKVASKTGQGQHKNN